MGIYRQTGSKNYWMIKTINGIKYRKSTETNSKMRAKAIYENWVYELKESIKTGKPIITTVKTEQKAIMTFTELADKYLEFAARLKSYSRLKSFVNTLKSAFGNKLVNEFNLIDLENFQNKIISKKLSPAYANRLVVILRIIFNKGVDWDLVSEDVVKKLKKCKLLKGENKRLRYLSDDEIERLLSYCEPYLKPIVITALNTGMRKSEIFNLTWDRVDLKNGLILLDKTKNGERREIPINDTLYRTLSGLTRHLKTDYVFYNPETLKPYDSLKRSWATALRKSHILDFHFHDLRHTFASRLVMKGVDLTTLKELLGHKDIKMTLRYSHLAPAHIRNAVNMLDNNDNKKSYFGHSEEKMGNVEILKPLLNMEPAIGIEPTTR